jgi:hypothetical protein
MGPKCHEKGKNGIKCVKNTQKFGSLKSWHYFCSVKNTQRVFGDEIQQENQAMGISLLAPGRDNRLGGVRL